MNADDTDWKARTMVRATKAARKLLCDLTPGTLVTEINDTQYGWLIAAVIFAWAAVKAEEAATKALDVDVVLRHTGLHPDPAYSGAIEATLPKLAELDLPWTVPIFDWEREQVLRLVTACFDLVSRASSTIDPPF